MKVYVGQTRASILIKTLETLGFGEITCPTEVPPRRSPWVYDNGAYRDWTAGVPFNEKRFMAGFNQMRHNEPEFIVCPDLVASPESLEFSLRWRVRLRGAGPLYLAVQDGMNEENVRNVMGQFDGIFVGGSLSWKLRNGERWVKLAHRLHKPCHIGRVGTFPRVLWARRIQADSIDSSLPLWSTGNLKNFTTAISSPLHPELF